MEFIFGLLFRAHRFAQPLADAVITINRTALREIEAMINRVAGNKAMPASIWQEIIERADGIPLFIEEITKAVPEAGSQGASERPAVVRTEWRQRCSARASLLMRGSPWFQSSFDHWEAPIWLPGSSTPPSWASQIS
jgi:hypothetical protein